MSEEVIEKPIDRSWPQFKEERFTPQISSSLDKVVDWHNCVSIAIDLSLTSPLKFEEKIKEAQAIIDQGFLLFFRLDLQLKKTYDNYFSEVTFEAYRLGLKIFHEKLLKPFLDKTYGLGFDFGCLNPRLIENKMDACKVKDYLISTYPSFDSFFGFSIEAFFDHLQDEKVKKEIDLYQMGLIGEYFHRLVSSIQESVEIYLFFDLQEQTSLNVLQFLSLERFPYMRVGLKNCPLPCLGLNIEQGKMLGGTLDGSTFVLAEPSIGIVFPNDQKLSFEKESVVSLFLERFLKLNLPFYVLYEDSMTENWQNLEEVIVLSSMVDKNLKRKCQGFAAAQGKVIVVGEPLGVLDEVSFDDFEKQKS
jgi:hypothetical protein